MTQLQLRPTTYSWERVALPSMEMMDAWAKRDGIVCLHDLVTIDNPWMGDLMTPSLKTVIRKSLLPSQQFRVSTGMHRQIQQNDMCDCVWVYVCVSVCVRLCLTEVIAEQDELKVVTSNLKETLGIHGFVALHARIEDDWEDYCTSDWFKVIRVTCINIDVKSARTLCSVTVVTNFITVKFLLS